MKTKIVLLSLMLSSISYAGGSDIGNAVVEKMTDNLSPTVRCSGLNSDGAVIGMDFQLDPVDRIESIAVFARDSVGIIETKDLGAPSIFLKQNARGEVQVFGFKSFNDGLEDYISISYVAGVPSLSRLQTGYGKVSTATSKIKCTILK